MTLYWFFLLVFLGYGFQVGCVCPVASAMAWVYVRVAWIDCGGHAGEGTDCSCDEGCYAFSCWDACQASQGRFSWLDYDQSAVVPPLSRCALTLAGVRRYSAQKQKCLVSWCVWYRCARDGEYVQGRDAEG